MLSKLAQPLGKQAYLKKQTAPTHSSSPCQYAVSQPQQQVVQRTLLRSGDDMHVDTQLEEKHSILAVWISVPSWFVRNLSPVESIRLKQEVECTK